jgi:hypothetical protein
MGGSDPAEIFSVHSHWWLVAGSAQVRRMRVHVPVDPL